MQLEEQPPNENDPGVYGRLDLRDGNSHGDAVILEWTVLSTEREMAAKSQGSG